MALNLPGFSEEISEAVKKCCPLPAELVSVHSSVFYGRDKNGLRLHGAAGTIDYSMMPIAQISGNVKRLGKNFLESVSFFGWLCYTYSATQFYIDLNHGE